MLTESLLSSLINVEGPHDCALVVKRESVSEAEKEDEEGEPRRHLEDLRQIGPLLERHRGPLQCYTSHQKLGHELVHLDVDLVEPQGCGYYLEVISIVDRLLEREWRVF